MSNVALTIAGRQFTVACAAGEESHVAALGRTIDAKLAALGDIGGQSESRMLLFAALLLADELHEAKSAPPPPPPPPAEAILPDDLAIRLDALASRLENLAELLEA